MDLQAQFEERISLLKGQYVLTLVERHERLVPVIAKLLEGTAAEAEVLQARFDIHKIAGTAASFSFFELGQAARTANQYIDGGDTVSTDAHVAFKLVVRRLSEAIATDCLRTSD